MTGSLLSQINCWKAEHLSVQILREAQHAESKADFIHKLKIAAKEASETEYWLLLCKYSLGYPDIADRLEKLLEIQKLLSKIISNTKKS